MGAKAADALHLERRLTFNRPGQGRPMTWECDLRCEQALQSGRRHMLSRESQQRRRDQDQQQGAKRE